MAWLSRDKDGNVWLWEKEPQTSIGAGEWFPHKGDRCFTKLRWSRRGVHLLLEHFPVAIPAIEKGTKFEVDLNFTITRRSECQTDRKDKRP